jgi:predicted CXXCH cytochrome family protein
MANRASPRIACLLTAGIVVIFAPAGARAQPAPQTQNGCATCHIDLTDPARAAPAAAFKDDVHRDRGFGCVDCHGGDPTTLDKARAKDPAKGYRGRPTGTAVIATCARCHSDAAFMRRFAPRQHVDQASEYAVSAHGIRLAKGDLRVATCASCHGAHGIRRISDARSTVFPTNVAATCAKCHANPEYMKDPQDPQRTPLPTNQLADYQKSVHYAALTRRNDLSAPTCNDCHGNHGAAPPGADSVANVCGTCHAVFAERFEKTTHREIFERGCAECHGNHAVLEADDAMLAGVEPGICAGCHSEGDNGFKAAQAMRASVDRLKKTLDDQATVVAGLRNAGMEVSDQELAINDARTHLTLARTEVHTASPAAVEVPIAEGLKILSGVERAAHQAQSELRFRRRGLAASLLAILFVVVALAFKIREIDRRPQPPPQPPGP